jgi:glutamyl-tRNA synthetase
LRGDGNPTYMLSVVIDDQDMGITHIIRGDDHLTNTFRQKQIYDAFGWHMPEVCHIPLIHGPDGAKLSKRHGAIGIEAYRDMGILPEAFCNYLLRLGWSHGDDEIISSSQAIEWFTLKTIGKSPARFDMTKLLSLNAHYLRQKPNAELVALIQPLLEPKVAHPLTAEELKRIEAGMDGLKERSKDLEDLATSARIYANIIPYVMEEEALKVLTPEVKEVLTALESHLKTVKSWQIEALEESVRLFSESQGVKLGKVAQPLRVALTGRTVSPGIFEIMAILGQKETLDRLHFVINSE